MPVTKKMERKINRKKVGYDDENDPGLSIKDGVWSFYENGRLTKAYVYEKGEVVDSLVVGQ